MKWSKLLSSKLFLSALVVLLALVGFSIYKEKRGSQEINQNIKSLEQEIAELDSQNLELAELIRYLRSNDYVEREAREKLGMKKEGEQVVIVPLDDKSGVIAGKEDVKDKKNWQLWVEYFFGNTHE